MRNNRLTKDDKGLNTAVIILNWNGKSLLEKFLPSVISGTNPDLADVIVADNGSTDGSLELLKSKFPSVKVISFDKNHGYAEGYNMAVKRIAEKYRYTVLLNSDVAVKPGWIEPLIDFMDNHPKAGACQPKILSFSNPEKFEYAGACGGFIDKNGYPFCRGRIFDTCEEDKGQYDLPVEIFWATGAALFIRTELYLEAGGLDPLFFAHMEEIDLCWRLQLMRRNLWVVPQSVVYHLGGGSLAVGNPEKTYLNFRNNLLLLYKNMPRKAGKSKLFKRRLLDTLAWAKFLLSLDFKNATAIFRAHRDFRKMKHNYNDQPQINLIDKTQPNHPNIVVSYYLRGIKKFSELIF